MHLAVLNQRSQEIQIANLGKTQIQLFGVWKVKLLFGNNIFFDICYNYCLKIHNRVFHKLSAKQDANTTNFVLALPLKSTSSVKHAAMK